MQPEEADTLVHFLSLDGGQGAEQKGQIILSEAGAGILVFCEFHNDTLFQFGLRGRGKIA